MIPNRYSYENLVKVLRNPSMFAEEVNRVINRAILELNNKHFINSNGDGINVMEQDWDNLILLDACRYDIFEEYSWLGGDLSKVVSKGSNSWEFLRKNFGGHQYHDTVYVTANAYPLQLPENTFYDVIPTFTHEGTERSSPVNFSPRDVHRTYKLGIKAYKNYPNKRIIIHFLPPHAPYFGRKAKKLRKKLERKYSMVFYDWMSEGELNRLGVSFSELKECKEAYQYLMRAAKYSPHVTSEELLEVYIENMKVVLEYVEELLQIMEGKTVISSDHGELLGESDRLLFKYTTKEPYFHPPGIYVPELKFVPWLERDSGLRKEIRKEKPVSSKSATNESVEKRLEALGYKTE